MIFMRPCTCSYNRSGTVSQAKGMFWPLMALKYVKADLFPEIIWIVLFVIRKWCLNSYCKLISGNGPLKIILRLKQLTPSESSCSSNTSNNWRPPIHNISKKISAGKACKSFYTT